MGIGANRIESINIPEYGISSVEFAANVSFLLSYSSSSSRYCKNNNGNFYVHTSGLDRLGRTSQNGGTFRGRKMPPSLTAKLCH